jgi:site-specific recombinase XerD
VGELHRLDRGGSPPLSAASAAYLATLSGPEQRNTQRAYRSTLRALAAEFAPPGTRFEVAELDDEGNIDRLTAWFTARWSGLAAATFNRHLDALRSAAAFWAGQGWLTTDPARRLRRRGRASDRTRAIPAAGIEALLGMDVPIREKTLWTMLYETAARSSEVLALDVEDLDRRNRRAKVTRKGSAVDIVVWQTGTARLLPRLLDGRPRGPVFLTERRARVALAAADIDSATGRARLSYRRAEEIFTETTKHRIDAHEKAQPRALAA